jgi:hypothetical protein
MNDNNAYLAKVYRVHGLGDQPNRCRCGSDATAVDSRSRRGRKEALFVWCAGCEREGPERPTYDLAVAAWNSSPAFSSGLA